jgi:cyclopropane fatty-acyl-phospholipid synthase-like methyltransferase
MMPSDQTLPLPVQRIRTRELVRGILTRALHPRHLWAAAQLHRSRKINRHNFDDAQLALYGQILPGEFIHYGYFDDPLTNPDEMSIAQVARAQARYAEMLLQLIGPAQPGQTVLDIGCGMGGLSRMLAANGFAPTALTPDRLQAAHIALAQPNLPIIRSKFERINADQHRGKYDIAITSESLQYLKLDAALPMMSAILAPAGRWIATDYFSIRPSADRSCHPWTDFTEKLTAAGWKITEQRDITANILPTLAYAYMWATRFGLPFFELAALRLRRKQPALHHLLTTVLDVLRGVATDNLRRVDPEWFTQNRKYMALVIEKSPAPSPTALA